MPRSSELKATPNAVTGANATDVVSDGHAASDTFFRPTTVRLKERSVRGGGIAVLAQGLTFIVQAGSTILLARLLSPEDFGLQGMVVAMTGILALFRDPGLSVATVQRQGLTHEEMSTMFWINAAVGALLAIIVAALGPFMVAFYKEPRLFAITMASASGFFFYGLAIQHRALLNRALRFVAMAKINVLVLAGSAFIAVSMAAMGFGYWALVGMTVSHPMLTAAAVWMAMPWVPGRPTWKSGVRSMLHIGGTVTLTSLVVYLAYNVEKILLGRFWGAEALGLYGRAYQIAHMPVDQLNSSLSAVAVPSLARLQGDGERLARFFLKAYSVVVSVTIPVTLGCALFPEEIVRILLGPKWPTAAAVLRLLAPTVLGFALITPIGWFLQATGRVGRGLQIALLIAPVVVLGIVAGLRHGPTGVALGYSTAMIVLVIPVVAWAVRGTEITAGAYWESIKRPLGAGVLAGAAGALFKFLVHDSLAPIPLLGIGLTLSLGLYAWIFLELFGERAFYLYLLRQAVQRHG